MLGGSHPLWCSDLMAKLTPAERLVLVYLAACANRDSAAWPSVPRVAEATGYSERVVKRAVAQLRHLDLIAADGRAPGRQSQYAAVRYRVLPGVTPTSLLDGSGVTPTSPPEVTPTSSRGDAHVTISNKEEPVEATPASDGSPIDPPPRRRSAAPKATKTHRADAHLEEAKRILGAWWERQNPRPQKSFIGAAKVLAKALGDGWTEPDLSAALNDVPTISGGALDYWRRTRRPSIPQTPADWLPNGGALTTERTG